MKTLNEMIEMHKRLGLSSDQHEDKCGAFYSAEEHRQLAECLEELAACRTQHAALCKKFGINTIEDLYDKGIDNFKEGIKEILEDNAIYNMDSINTLAEQLKEATE